MNIEEGLVSAVAGQVTEWCRRFQGGERFYLRFLSAVAERLDAGSRGFQATVAGPIGGSVAERRLNPKDSSVAPRRRDTNGLLPWAEAHGYRHRLAPRGAGPLGGAIPSRVSP